MLKCPYEHCKSNQVTSLFYRETYRDGRLVCLTYECICRECEGRFAHSMNLDLT